MNNNFFLILFFFLAIGFVFSFNGGDGTQSNPYQIVNCTQLQEIDNYSTDQMHFVLKNNINCNGFNFVPIGGKYSAIRLSDGSFMGLYGFNGVLDGNNFEIQNLKIDSNIAGLFSHVNPFGVIKNINLVNHDITGTIVAGSLVAYNQGFIRNVHSIGNVYLKIPLIQTGYVRFIGGLVGENRFFTAYPDLIANKSSGLIINSSSQGNVGYTISHTCGDFRNYGGGGGLAGSNVNGTIINSNSSGQVNLPCNAGVGGLVGYNLYGNLFNNYSTKTVTGLYQVGGLVGSLDNHNTNLVLFNYYNGSVTAKNGLVGGLIGYGVGGEIAYNYSLGNIYSTGTPGFIGGLIGELTSLPLYPDIYTNLHNNYSKSSIPSYYDGLNSIGGFIGNSVNGFIHNNYYGGSSQVQGTSVGGFIGEATSVELYNNYSLANVAGNSDSIGNYRMVGGFIGILYGDTNIQNNFCLGNVTKSSSAVHYIGGFIGELKQPIDTSNNWWFLGNFNKIGRCLGSDGVVLSTCDASNSVSYRDQFKGNNTFGPYPNWSWQTLQKEGDWIIDNCGVNSNYPILSFQVNGACGAASYFDLTLLDYLQEDTSLLCSRGTLKQDSFKVSEDGYDANWICESPNPSCGGIDVFCKKWLPACKQNLSECENNRDCCSNLCNNGVCVRSCSTEEINLDCPSYCNESNDFGCSCGNGVCNNFENSLTCEKDCPSCSLSYDFKCPSYCNALNDYDCACGNNKIEDWETCRNCLVDVCNQGERCSVDNQCELIPSYCGNQIVDLGETCSSCPSDVKCKFNEECVKGVCKRINSITKFDLFVDTNNIYALVKCEFDTNMVISLSAEENQFAPIKVNCNNVENKYLLLSGVKEGIVYRVGARIDPECIVCSREDYILSEKEIEQSIPDNSLIGLILVLMFVVGIIFSSPKK